MVEKINYAPLIKDMVWSYSRVKAYEDCPHRWFLKYIQFPKAEGIDLFFSSYGGFVHCLLERYYKGEITTEELQMLYVTQFRRQVLGAVPNETVFSNYFQDGLAYLQSLRPFPSEIILVEEKIQCEQLSKSFVGYLDLLLQEEDGSYTLIDHKSRALKPRSQRKKPTKLDGELDVYLIQLYLYSTYIKKQFGVFPQKLCFNCFRKKVLIEEPFSIESYEKSMSWFQEKITSIEKEEDFMPKMDYFKCRYLCDMQDYCDYYHLSRR